MSLYICAQKIWNYLVHTLYRLCDLRVGMSGVFCWHLNAMTMIISSHAGMSRVTDTRILGMAFNPLVRLHASDCFDGVYCRGVRGAGSLIKAGYIARKIHFSPRLRVRGSANLLNR